MSKSVAGKCRCFQLPPYQVTAMFAPTFCTGRVTYYGNCMGWAVWLLLGKRFNLLPHRYGWLKYQSGTSTQPEQKKQQKAPSALSEARQRRRKSRGPVSRVIETRGEVRVLAKAASLNHRSLSCSHNLPRKFDSWRKRHDTSLTLLPRVPQR